MIITDTFWRTRLGSTQDVLGKSVRLDDEPYTITGVMPPSFAFPAARTLFRVPDATKTQTRLNVLARLRSDLSFEAGQGGVDALTSRLKKEQPDVVPADLRLISLDSHRINPRPRQALLSLLGAVGLVLLLSCANAANLLLARAADRRVESVSIASGAAPSVGGFHLGLDVQIEGRPPEARDGKLILPMSRIDEDYFKTMRIPVLCGRGYPTAEPAGVPAIIVNAEMARRYWPNQDPTGPFHS